jgi:hypothetical protein
LGQKSRDFFDLSMGLVVIPADYEECSSSVVPIYIRTEDDLGNRINDGWIHAAARAAGYIRSFARYFLSDEWRASELADETVQDLWTLHRDDLGRLPHRRVTTHAKWKALDKSVGGRQIRAGIEGELLEHILATLQQPPGFDEQIEHRDFWNRIEERLVEMGMADMREMLEIALHHGELKFESKRGERRNTLSKRFYRAVRKAATLL